MAAAAIGLIVLLLDLTLAGVPAFSHAFAYSGLVMVLVAVRQVSLNGDLRRGLIWSSLTILTTSVLVSLQGGMSLPANKSLLRLSPSGATFLSGREVTGSYLT